ncbi:MAG: GNAT family N-acetyltransferase [Planctomycetota bacterium]
MGSNTRAAVHVEKECGRRDRKAFLEVPYRLNRGLPHWVPPLRVAEKAIMDRKRNPFFEHAEVEHFLARRGRRVVGRIAAIHNRAHNETFEDRLGFFGFFDAEEDPEAARGLVDAARTWVGARGLDRIRGPVNYSTNDTCGVLVEGFDRPPVILMPYNRPYYDTLLKGAGLEEAKDLLAFRITHESRIPDRLRRVVGKRMARSKVVFRPIDTKHIDREIDGLLDVYNRCWADNWGFVPATVAEFRHAAREMVPILETNLSRVAELDGRPVGLSLMLRDLNVLLHGTNGHLLPRALPRILLRLKHVKTMRILALGVVPECRGRGIAEALFLHCIDEGLRRGYPEGEAGWILEDNRLMQAPILAVGGQAVKRYRIYEAPAHAAGQPLHA